VSRVRRWGQLDDPHIGLRVELMLTDGLGRIDARIAEIIPHGEFASWRADRAVGGYDLNTFLIRADPIAGAEGLQPGLMVWLNQQ
jgi:hypothetical protein